MESVYEVKDKVNDLKKLKNKIQSEIKLWESKYVNTSNHQKQKQYGEWIRDNQKQIDQINFKLEKLNKWLYHFE